MQNKVVFLNGVCDDNLFFLGIFEYSRIAGLASALGVKGRLIQNDLIVFPGFGFYFTVTHDPGIGFCGFVTQENRLNERPEFHPVSFFGFGSLSGTFLLSRQFFVEFGRIHGKAFFPGHQNGQVQREPVRVVKKKCVFAAEFLKGFVFCEIFKQSDSFLKSPEERFFFLADYIFNQLLLLSEFRECLTHLFYKSGNQPAKEWFVKPQERVSVTHCPAQDPADNVSGFYIRRELSVGNRETDSPQVVGYHAHGNVCILVLPVCMTSNFFYGADQVLEDIRVIIAVFTLYGHAEPFQSHSGVDVLLRQLFERSIGFPVILNKYQVPDLNNQRMTLIYKGSSGYRSTVSGGAQIDMYLATGTARTGIAHFPKIIFFISGNNMIVGKYLLPIGSCLVIGGDSIFSRTFKNAGIQTVCIELKPVTQQLPRPGNGLFLEIIPETPVTKHLEHGVVVSVVSHFFKIVMFAAHPKTFLSICHPAVCRRFVPQKPVFELIHSRVGEHKRGVVLYYHRGGRHNGMSFLFKEIQKGLSYFLRGHILNIKAQIYRFL